MSKDILEIENLTKKFSNHNNTQFNAVNNVSFSMKKGETLGVVGESGSGKTTLGKTCIGMYDADYGKVSYKGKNLHKFSRQEKFDFTKEAQMIFQDPYNSLDPRQRAYDILNEGIQIHKLASSKKEEKQKVLNLLESVGLNPEHANRNVHEFSGGQRQRIGIARALSISPEFLFCDEPVSALDVSTQAQIINLLQELKSEYNLTMLFIAHDLSMVKYISDRVAVMYLGNLVEIGPTKEIFSNPQHAYTKTLLRAIPIPNPRKARQKKTIYKQTNEIQNYGYSHDSKTKMLKISDGHYISQLEK